MHQTNPIRLTRPGPFRLPWCCRHSPQTGYTTTRCSSDNLRSHTSAACKEPALLFTGSILGRGELGAAKKPAYRTSRFGFFPRHGSGENRDFSVVFGERVHKYHRVSLEAQSDRLLCLGRKCFHMEITLSPILTGTYPGYGLPLKVQQAWGRTPTRGGSTFFGT